MLLTFAIVCASFTGCAKNKEGINDFSVSVKDYKRIQDEGVEYLCLTKKHLEEIFACEVELVRNG